MTPRSRRRPALGLALLALGALAGCAYQGAIDQPVTIKATWFSYLNGDDIRAACTDGAPSWYRLVYNGNYEEQLRSYEVVADGTGGAYYTVRVQTGSGLDLTKFSFGDLQAVAGWTTVRTRLIPADLAALERALEASDAFGPAPVGLVRARELAVNVVLPFLHALAALEDNQGAGESYLSLYQRFGMLQSNELTREMASQLLAPAWRHVAKGARRQQGLLHLHHLLSGYP